MYKITLILLQILLILVHSQNNTRCEDQEKVALNATDCIHREIEKEEDEDYCCFVKYKTKIGKIIKGCAPLSEKEFLTLEETIESFESLQDIKIMTFECFTPPIKYRFTLIYIIILIILI